MNATKPVILIADDEADSLNLLTNILGGEGYEVRASDSGELALASAAAHTPDLILLDLRMPGMDGLEVCRRLKESEPTRETPLMFISGAADVEERVRGLAMGAVDFVTKPFRREELVARVRTHLELGRLRANLESEVAHRTAELRTALDELRESEEKLRQSLAEIEQLKDKLQAEGDYLKAEMRLTTDQGAIIGRSEGIRNVLQMVEQVAPTVSSVLVRGETGTGKELIAQAIHRLSPRKNNMMIKVNCAALPAGLVESELFGREKGAFTGALTRQVGRFEIADNSTLFLDEIGELPLDLQAKLLRVLESGEFERLGSPRTIKVNVRVIAATNRDLPEAIKEGKFRQDLYYRLNVFPIQVPPLRDRADDIPPLVWAFLEEFSSRMGKKISRIPRKSMDAFQSYSWPGNVRELRNVIEHSAIITTGDTLRTPLLDEAEAPVAAHRQTLAEAEREHIVRVLERNGWHIKGPKGAAAELGLNPATLYGRMKKLGIRPSRQGENGSD